MPYLVERTRDNVLTVRHNEVASGWSQAYLLMADVHWDNPHCDRAMLTRHLEYAKAHNAGVMVFGDFFCAMQGKYDKRSDKSALRPEHQGGNYLDLLVDTAAEYLAPYAANMVMIGDGNHETSIRTHLETDLLARLCQKIDTNHMGYSGFVRFMFEAESGGQRSSRRLYYHHGYGGGGPVTKGVIGTNRRAAYVDADFFAGGHIHESTIVENVVLRLSDSGAEQMVTQIHIQLPTYKQEFDLRGGFHVEKGRPPKPTGAWMLEFFYRRGMPSNVHHRVVRMD